MRINVYSQELLLDLDDDSVCEPAVEMVEQVANTSGGTITARAQGGPHVKVKAAEINRYAATIPAHIKDELVACRDAGTANAVYGYRLCRDTREHTHLPYQRDRICPATEAQEQDHRDEYWRIVDWQKRILIRALGLDGQSHVPGDQLDLFGVTV